MLTAKQPLKQNHFFAKKKNNNMGKEGLKIRQNYNYVIFGKPNIKMIL